MISTRGKKHAVYCRKLGFRYSSRLPWVIRELDFRLFASELTCLIGANGSGKTTLARLLASELEAEEGSVVASAGASEVGFRYQEYEKNLLPWYSAERNLALTGYYRSHSVDLSRWLDLAQFEQWRGKATRSLSGGQRQFLSLFCVLALDSSILIMDEPFSALDPSVVPKVWAETRVWVREHCIGCLIITHNLEEAVALGDRVVILVDGAHGQLKEFTVNRGDHESAFLTSDAARSLREDILQWFYGLR